LLPIADAHVIVITPDCMAAALSGWMLRAREAVALASPAELGRCACALCAMLLGALICGSRDTWAMTASVATCAASLVAARAWMARGADVAPRVAAMALRVVWTQALCFWYAMLQTTRYFDVVIAGAARWTAFPLDRLDAFVMAIPWLELLAFMMYIHALRLRTFCSRRNQIKLARLSEHAAGDAALACACAAALAFELVPPGARHARAVTVCEACALWAAVSWRCCRAITAAIGPEWRGGSAALVTRLVAHALAFGAPLVALSALSIAADARGPASAAALWRWRAWANLCLGSSALALHEASHWLLHRAMKLVTVDDAGGPSVN